MVTLVLVLLVALLLAISWLVMRTRRRIGHSYADAEWQLHSASRAARRQMNDAAGQSWRNLVE